jgi:hypothetical protein
MGGIMRNNMYSINLTSEAVVKLLKVAIKKGLIDDGKKRKSKGRDAVDKVTLLENSYPVGVITDNHRGIIYIQMKTNVHGYCKISEAGELPVGIGLITSNEIRDE